MKGKITVVEVHTWGLYEVPRGWALYEIPGGTTLREIAHKAPILVLDWRPGTLASPSETLVASPNSLMGRPVWGRTIREVEEEEAEEKEEED